MKNFQIKFQLFLTLLIIFRITLHSLNSQFQEIKDQNPLQYEVKVTLKLIQVYVTDKKGNPVENLGREDFIVYDNGKKQLITEFERHILRFPDAIIDVEPEILKENTLSPPRELLGRKFFLLFDFAYNNPMGILKARKAALDFINNHLLSSDEVAVLSYSALRGLKIHEYLTINHTKARKVVEELGMKDIHGRAENFEGGEFEDAGASKKQISELERKESLLQATNFISKITDFAKALRYIPGIKYLILFSSGVPYSMIGGRGSGISSTALLEARFSVFGKDETMVRLKYEDMLKELAASNTKIFAIDTEDPAKIVLDSRVLGSSFLQNIASSTGGQYFGNINYYENHLKQIQNFTGCYYVLGYYIDEKWDGEYHKIKVEMKKPGLSIHAQRGYFNPKPFKEYSDLERMLHLVDLALNENPLFQTPIRFHLHAFSLNDEANLCLISKIEEEKLREVLKGKFEIVSIIFDEKEDIVELRREENTEAGLKGENFYYYSFFSLPAGTYKARLVIRNLETGVGAVASSSALIEKKEAKAIKLFAPLFLSAKKNALYLRGSLPRKGEEKLKSLSLGNVFHFDINQYSPYLDDSIETNSSLFAILLISIPDIPSPQLISSPEIKISALLTEKSSGKMTHLDIIPLSEKKDGNLYKFFVNISIPELPESQYDLVLRAEEKNSKSISQWTKTIKLNCHRFSLLLTSVH